MRVQARPSASNALETATFAEKAVADTEMIVASLCHDVGKLISVWNHPAIAAEILKPYVREEIYDAMLGLKNELRYNRRTGLPKKAPQPLIPACFRAYKVVTTGRACYVVLR